MWHYSTSPTIVIKWSFILVQDWRIVSGKLGEIYHRFDVKSTNISHNSKLEKSLLLQKGVNAIQKMASTARNGFCCCWFWEVFHDTISVCFWLSWCFGWLYQNLSRFPEAKQGSLWLIKNKKRIKSWVTSWPLHLWAIFVSASRFIVEEGGVNHKQKGLSLSSQRFCKKNEHTATIMIPPLPEHL